MDTHLLKISLDQAPMPPGFVLVGWINRHPNDTGPVKTANAVLRSAAGVEVAWDGGSIRSLPRNWREMVKFESC